MSLLDQAIFVALFVVSTGADTVWTPTDAKFDRRLTLELVESHPNDADCVVGGFNTDSPTHIYVGGPCSELGADNTPSANFRWVEMYTFYANLRDTAGQAAELRATGGVMRAQNKTTYAEVNVGGEFSFEDADAPKAMLFSSTASYLAKSTFEFNEVSFVTGYDTDTETYETVDGVCVQKCCDADCTCDNGCPTSMIKATAGEYKYSIFAASYNGKNATNGAVGNAWERIVDKYGEGSPKQLRGTYNVYQAIDFTNMKANTLTVISPDGSSVMFSDMTTCSKAKLAECTTYSVASVNLEDDIGFAAAYSFPSTYNRGDWQENAGKVVPSVSDTKTVKIEMIRPDDEWLKSIQMSGKTLVILEYSFNATGITAGNGFGTWLAYDPSVKRAVRRANVRNSGDSSTSNPSVSGSTSRLPMIQLALSVVALALVQSFAE
jgi:hypothetical protein